MEGILLSDARNFVKRNMKKGMICPCCDQFVKLYSYSINSWQASWLIELYRIGGHDRDVNVIIEMKPRNRTYSLLRFWGLVEPVKDRPIESNKKSAGFWRLTERGRLFVQNKILIPKFAMVYNNQCESTEGKGVSIIDCLNNKFNYYDLLHG